jgi:hypothetical protein
MPLTPPTLRPTFAQYTTEIIRKALKIAEKRTGQAPFLAVETLERFARAVACPWERVATQSRSPSGSLQPNPATLGAHSCEKHGRGPL